MSGAAQGDMTPGVITCTSCGHSSRAGLVSCPACARPLADRAAVGVGVASGAGDAPLQLAFTNSWDSVAPRLQEALYGEFVISRELGRGGMAAVFLAHQLKLNRKVAIKVMAPSLMTGVGLVERFRDEALTVARLEHPNITSIFEVGEATGLQYFVMQYIPGRSLERVIRQWGQVPIDVVRGILFEVGRALSYAHRREVIHRDVKPGNILLGLDGRVLVSDFGIAKVAQSASRTQTGAVIGTPSYMSPEQCLGRPLTWSADQYSLGVIAYEMLTGAQPFSGTSYAVMRGHIEDPVPDVLASRPDCPPNVAAAVSRMLAKHPADRFASMSDALSAMGASRMSMDDAVQEAVGRLAVPLPEEDGVVLVHTPASPAPQPYAVVGVGSTPAAQPDAGGVVSASRRGLAAVRERAKLISSAARAALAQGSGVVIAGFGRLGNVAARLASVLWTRAAAVPRRWWAIGGASTAVLATAAIAFAVLGTAERQTTRDSGPTQADSATGTLTTPPSPLGDSLARDPTDSVTSTRSADSIDVGVDSTAPHKIAIRVRGSGRITVGDTVDLIAVITDVGRRRIDGVPLVWRSSRRDRATVDSTTGRLVATGSGRVTVSVAAAGLDTVISLNIVPQRSAGAPAVTSQPVERSIEVPTAVDEEAEKDAVDRVLAAFVREVLEGRDRQRIDELSRAATADDSIGLAVLLKAYADHKILYVRSEQNPPRPVIVGDRATADARIGLEWQRRFRGSRELSLQLHVEFQRVASGWRAIAFRLRPIR
jgi:hypothetical protein